jgi:hypothetical protein
MATAGYGHYEIEGRIEEIIPILESRFGGTFTRCYEQNGRCYLAILMGEKFSLWWGVCTAVSIILRAEPYMVTMEVIGFAGGRGLINLDWGRNKSIVHQIAKYIAIHGFKITRTHFTEIPRHSPHKHYLRIEPLPPTSS